MRRARPKHAAASRRFSQLGHYHDRKILTIYAESRRGRRAQLGALRFSLAPISRKSRAKLYDAKFTTRAACHDTLPGRAMARRSVRYKPGYWRARCDGVYRRSRRAFEMLVRLPDWRRRQDWRAGRRLRWRCLLICAFLYGDFRANFASAVPLTRDRRRRRRRTRGRDKEIRFGLSRLLLISARALSRRDCAGRAGVDAAWMIIRRRHFSRLRCNACTSALREFRREILR